MNLQIKDIINEIRPVVINKKRTELDARHDIGRENKVTEIMELISTKNIDLMEYLESMLYRVIQRVSMLSKEKFSSDSSVVLKSPISLLRGTEKCGQLGCCLCLSVPAFLLRSGKIVI